ncbi:MAG: hypothetical protein NVS2B16_05390 [Chloroflexota bacterium]
MAVKMRLRRMGAKHQPSYRIVIADSRSPRDGRYIDQVGFYNPLTNPATINVDQEKAIDWLRKGAQPTDTVVHLLRKFEIVPEVVRKGDASSTAVSGGSTASTPAPVATVPVTRSAGASEEKASP